MLPRLLWPVMLVLLQLVHHSASGLHMDCYELYGRRACSTLQCPSTMQLRNCSIVIANLLA